MKLIKQPKCRKCHTLLGRDGLHCRSVLMNGCDAYYCFLCWSAHSRIHDVEWLEMTEDEKDALITDRTDNG